MIVVAGTMRSGTSMWMQTLEAAGLPIIGSAFPGKWEERIGEANPKGFFESSLRDGIFYKTNPHPESGAYLHPDQTQRCAVKVFAAGLVRTDIAFLQRVVFAIRPVRQYVRSLTRLMAMENESRSEEAGRPVDLPPHVPHALRWWDDNFSAFRDILIRGYPTHAMAYDTVLEDPDSVARTLRWLGAPDVEAGLSSIDASQRTQVESPSEGQAPEPAPIAADLDLAPDVVEVFDELYARVHSSQGFDDAFLARMGEVDAQLEPLLKQARIRVDRARRQRMKRARERRKQTEQAQQSKAP